MSLDHLLKPASVAVVGASQNPQKVGGMPVRLLKELGFGGPIYPINPASAEVQGLVAYPSLRDVPGKVELAIIALPAPGVAQALEQAAEAGVRTAIVLSSGFAEVDAQGADMQARLVQIAQRSGMTLLGPNCLGVMSLRHAFHGTFSPAPLAGQAKVGAVAVVSQSGAFGAYAYSLARAAGVGLSHWVTTGNEASTSVADVIDGLAHDPETRVILAYVEGARDGHSLARALEKARLAGKPVVVTKVGRTAAGARAALSHTASLSGEDSVYQAVFDESGTIRANTVEQMFRLGHAFSVGVRPRGRRLAILTVSGGVGTLMADAASDAGLEMPELPADIASELRRRIAFCSTANPVDLTGQITADYGVIDHAAVEAARSGAYDCIVLFLAAAGAAPGYAPKIVNTIDLVRAAAPHVSLAFAGIVTPSLKAGLEQRGCLVYEEPTHAIESLSVMATWEAASSATSFARLADNFSADVHMQAGLLNEVEGLAFLAAHGIEPAEHRQVRHADEAVRALNELGGKLVLKIVSRDLLHKSDVGGVRVGLRTSDEVRQAFDDIQIHVSRLAPAARQEGMLVARQLNPRVELMLGARWDESFGPIVVLGLGGVAVELDPRTCVITAPTHPARVRSALEQLGILKRMGAWRGHEAIEPSKLIDTVVRFADVASAMGPRLRTLEVNPLMVTEQGAFAADAVVEITPA